MSMELSDMFQEGSSACCDAPVYNDGRCKECMEICEVMLEADEDFAGRHSEGQIT